MSVSAVAARSPAGTATLALLAGCAGATAVAELALPAVLGATVDAVVRGTTSAAPVLWCLALVAVIAVAEPVRDLAAGTLPAHATGALRRRLVRHALALGPRRAGATGDVVSRVVGSAADAGQRRVAVVLAATGAVPVVGAVVALAFLDPWLVAGYLGGAAVVAVLLHAHVRDTVDAVVRYQRGQADIASRLSEALGGIRTVAASGTVDVEIERCLRPLPDLSAAGTRTWRVLARSAAQGALAGPLLQLSVIAIGGWLLARGRLTPGALVAAIQYAALGAGLGGVVAGLNRVARARAGGRRVAELLERPAPRHGTRALPPGPGTLTFSGVSAGEPGRRVLRDITFTVPGGATVAVVGRSGAGKSLLAALAARLAVPDAGEVRLDDVPLGELSESALRRAIGVAFERPALVGATVADAVGLGHDAPDPAAVAAALRAARADGFVARLPRGADTPLAETPLSGGEAQRLGLARAWHGERLLVLDDATSSLDTVTEAEIVRLLTDGPDRRTHLVVAHRAVTARRCAFVVWLDGGRVRAVGRHDELWGDARYRAVFGGTS